MGPVIIPGPLFEFMYLSTEQAEFRFEDMNAQIDGVSMGISLGPDLANIFVGYYERLFLEKCQNPFIYVRYVDDTFSIFVTINESNIFSPIIEFSSPRLRIHDGGKGGKFASFSRCFGGT